MKKINPNIPPNFEILSYAVKSLTKSWSDEEQEKFSKKCFDTVCTEKYIKYAECVRLDIKIINQ